MVQLHHIVPVAYQYSGVQVPATAAEHFHKEPQCQSPSYSLRYERQIESKQIDAREVIYLNNGQHREEDDYMQADCS